MESLRQCGLTQQRVASCATARKELMQIFEPNENTRHPSMFHVQGDAPESCQAAVLPTIVSVFFVGRQMYMAAVLHTIHAPFR